MDLNRRVSPSQEAINLKIQPNGNPRDWIRALEKQSTWV